VPSVLVDSNILLDIFTANSPWTAWSLSALSNAANTGRLVINPVIYAEASVRFTRIDDFEDALPAAEREPIPYDAAFLAGKVYLEYRRRGGTRLSPLPDFFIGAHAAIRGYELLTRDPARYRSYFPRLKLIAPD
jgi:predicted nucleic acid-binding protein